MIQLIGKPPKIYRNQLENLFNYSSQILREDMPFFDSNGSLIYSLKIFNEVKEFEIKKIAFTKISTCFNTCFFRKSYDWNNKINFSEMVDYVKNCHDNLYLKLKNLNGNLTVLDEGLINKNLSNERIIISPYEIQ